MAEVDIHFGTMSSKLLDAIRVQVETAAKKHPAQSLPDIQSDIKDVRWLNNYDRLMHGDAGSLENPDSFRVDGVSRLLVYDGRVSLF